MSARVRLLVPLALVGLACSVISRTPPPVATPTATTGATPSSTDTPTPGPPAFIPPECSDVPLATVPPETALAEPAAALADNPPLSTEGQLALLDDLASTVETQYLYPAYNGVDWPALVTLARTEIASGVDTETFYEEVRTLVLALNDDHSYFESPVEVAASQAELEGTADYVGIGVLVIPLPEKGRASIVAVFPGSAAEHAGLRPHDSLLTADGLPIVENGVALVQRVRGPECSAVVVTVQSPGEAPRRVQLVRHRLSTSVPVAARLLAPSDGSRIGYIFLPTFFDRTLPDQVRRALEEFGTLDGLILDNRFNGGGSSDVVETILSFFTSGTLGHFVSRDSERSLVVPAEPVANAHEVPLVVLVGEDTVSFGEIFAGVLQDTGRATIVGQTTFGNVETLHGFSFDDGSTMWLAAEGFRPLKSGADWETTGVVPSVEVIADWDSFTFETDPGIAAALALLGH